MPGPADLHRHPHAQSYEAVLPVQHRRTGKDLAGIARDRPCQFRQPDGAGPPGGAAGLLLQHLDALERLGPRLSDALLLGSDERHRLPFDAHRAEQRHLGGTVLTDDRPVDLADLHPLGLRDKLAEAEGVVERVADDLPALEAPRQPGGVVERVDGIGGGDHHGLRAVRAYLPGDIAHEDGVLGQHLGTVARCAVSRRY